VVSFHGSLNTDHPAKAGKMKVRMLVLTGEADPFVPPEQVEAFKKEMNAAKASYKVIAYPGAKHAFTNKEADQYGQKFNLPLAYNAEADHKSWAEMQAFLKEIFAKK
jgi:dienelactone hydrolase